MTMIHDHISISSPVLIPHRASSPHRVGVVVLTSGASAKKERSGVYNICGDIIRKIYDECQPNPISR